MSISQKTLCEEMSQDLPDIKKLDCSTNPSMMMENGQNDFDQKHACPTQLRLDMGMKTLMD